MGQPRKEIPENMAKNKKRKTKEGGGSLFAAVRFVRNKAVQGKSVTLPQTAEHFGVCQSTADNWLRNGADKGLLKRTTHPAGTFDGERKTRGRPPSEYTITSLGNKALEHGSESEYFDLRRSDAAVEKRAATRAQNAKAKPAKKRKAKNTKKVKAKKAVKPEPEAAKKEARAKELKAARDARYRANQKAKRKITEEATKAA